MQWFSALTDGVISTISLALQSILFHPPGICSIKYLKGVKFLSRCALTTGRPVAHPIF